MRVVLGIIVGFLRFWYDFIVGDSWEIAAGVATALVGGVLLVRYDAVLEGHLPVVLTVALVAVLMGSVVVELRRKLSGSRE